MHGTGCAGVRGRGRSHRLSREPEASAVPVGAGKPAKHPARWAAPATPVFAAKAAPTGHTA
ncbi:hypothetical protein C6A77_12490 [Pseudomonas sp. AFG_SD02_1510_Pfu_092]|nr:hypothetical protein C6A77_12490 [Pseudomonas sp. AFG_SD02_1510_Pfu_092]